MLLLGLPYRLPCCFARLTLPLKRHEFKTCVPCLNSAASSCPIAICLTALNIGMVLGFMGDSHLPFTSLCRVSQLMTLFRKLSDRGIPCHHLGKMMLDELQRRNFAETPIDSYIRAVEDFSRFFNCSPDRLGPRHIREYQAALFQKRKLSPNTVAQHLAALRFFYVKTLKKAWSITETPYPKKAIHLPTILSQEAVARR